MLYSVDIQVHWGFKIPVNSIIDEDNGISPQSFALNHSYSMLHWIFLNNSHSKRLWRDIFSLELAFSLIFNFAAFFYVYRQRRFIISGQHLKSPSLTQDTTRAKDIGGSLRRKIVKQVTTSLHAYHLKCSQTLHFILTPV